MLCFIGYLYNARFVDSISKASICVDLDRNTSFSRHVPRYAAMIRIDQASLAPVG